MPIKQNTFYVAWVIELLRLWDQKGIQDKNSVTHFWLSNFSLLFAADFQANPADISNKEVMKIKSIKN